MVRVRAVLAQVVRSSLQVDRSKISLDVAMRATVGVAVPLVAAQLAGHALVGVTIAIGALSGGFASFQGAYRTRAAAVMAASAAMALSAFVGATVGHVLGYDMAIVAVWGFGAGLLVALGQTATVIGVQAVVGLVVFSQFHMSAASAARQAGFVLLGGLVQTLLVVVLWPLRRYPAERQALSEAYAELAGYVRTVLSGDAVFVPPAALDNLGVVLSDPQPLATGPELAAHTALASQADRIRLELTALAGARRRLVAAGEIRAARAVDALARAAAGVLQEIASALREARPPTGWDTDRDQFEGALSTLRARIAEEGRGDSTPSPALEQAAGRSEALAGQLRAAVRIAAIPAGGDPAALEEAALTGRAGPAGAARPRLVDLGRARERISTLRANLALSSEACRHGLRLAVSLAMSVGLARLIGLPHGYWLPMTVMIVLRPDFAGTFTRGLSRLVGTLVGAGVITVALAEWRPGQAGLTALVIGWCFAAYSVLFANYAAYSVCIASLVVTLLAFTGQPELSVAGDRSIYTAIGAGLALLAYALWPTWAASYLPERLGSLVDTEGRYGRAVLAAWAEPNAADRVALQRARLNARLARSNAEAAAERWMLEPAGASGLRRDLVSGILAEVRAYVQGVLSLHAQLPSNGRPRPDLLPLADDVAHAMASVAATLTTGLPPARWPQLRAEQLRLTASSGGRDQDVVLASETDLIVNAVNTLGHLVGAGRTAEGMPGDSSGVG